MTQPSRPLDRRHLLSGAAALGIGVGALSACGSDDAGSGASGSAGGSGDLSTSDVPEGGGVILEDEQTVVTQPSSGEFKAFDSTCTHQGCQVNEVTETINCPCHGSKFSITDGSVVAGPASSPLPEKSVTADGDTLTLG